MIEGMNFEINLQKQATNSSFFHPILFDNIMDFLREIVGGPKNRFK